MAEPIFPCLLVPVKEDLRSWKDEVGVVVQDHNPHVATTFRNLISFCALTLRRKLFEIHSEGSKLLEFIMSRAGVDRIYKILPERPG